MSALPVIEETPVLVSVPKPKTKAALAPFVIVLAILLGAGMIGQVALATALQSQGSVADDLRRQSQGLANRLSDLQAEVAQTSSMTSLAAKASALGMRPNTYPVQIELPSGRIVGKPTAVTGGEVPGDRYRTPEQLAEQRAAADEAARKAEEAKKAEEEAKKAAEEAKKAAAKNPTPTPKPAVQPGGAAQ